MVPFLTLIVTSRKSVILKDFFNQIEKTQLKMDLTLSLEVSLMKKI